MLFAFGLLPVLVPTAILLIEPPGRRRAHMAPFVVIEAITSVSLFRATATRPVENSEVHHSIACTAHAPLLGVAAVGYVLATVGAALLAGYRSIVAFGVANALGLTAVLVVLAEAFASIWCVWAPFTSGLVLLFFVRRNRAQCGSVKRFQQVRPASA